MPKKIMESLLKDTCRNEKEILEFCKFHGITLEEYRELVDRAIAARKQLVPDDYPKAKILYPSDTQQF
jgi:hypothetical protein